jgi:hypothetical protein
MLISTVGNADPQKTTSLAFPVILYIRLVSVQATPLCLARVAIEWIYGASGDWTGTQYLFA